MSLSDRRAVVALCCIAIFVLGILIVLDAVEGQKEADTAAKAKAEAELKRDSAARKGKHANRGYVVRRGYHKHEYNKEYRATTYHNADTTSAKERARASMKFAEPTKVDVNTADSATLCRIPGVGGKTARWIVSYRQKLGGFYSVRQLLDIPIVSDDLLEWVVVGKQPDVRTIDINHASFRQLNMHPYISYEQTKALTNYIRLYGCFADSAVLCQSGIFNADELDRLLPYIIF